MNLTNAITAIINWGMNSMGEFLFERLSDPEYYEENRVAAHSDHVAYRNWDEADVWLDPLGRKSSFRLFLDGSWKFHYAKNYEQTIRGFEKPEYDCRGWDDIPRAGSISRWKAMTARSTRTRSIRGTEGKTSGRTRCRRSSIRSQVM